MCSPPLSPSSCWSMRQESNCSIVPHGRFYIHLHSCKKAESLSVLCLLQSSLPAPSSPPPLPSLADRQSHQTVWLLSGFLCLTSHLLASFCFFFLASIHVWPDGNLTRGCMLMSLQSLWTRQQCIYLQAVDVSQHILLICTWTDRGSF